MVTGVKFSMLAQFFLFKIGLTDATLAEFGWENIKWYVTIKNMIKSNDHL